MSSDQTSDRYSAQAFLRRHSMLQILLGGILITLALRAALFTLGLNDVLARLMASLVFIAIPIIRLALPGGLDAASQEISQGWEHGLRWLALVSWKRLLVFSIVAYVGMYCSLHAAFLRYGHELAFFGIIFGLLAIAIAARIRIPETTQASRPESDSPQPVPTAEARAVRPAIGLVGKILILVAILAALAIGFAAGWASHLANHSRFSITEDGITIGSPEEKLPAAASHGHAAAEVSDSDEEEPADKDIVISQPNGQRIHIHKSADGSSREVQISDGQGRQQINIHRQAAVADGSAPASHESAPVVSPSTETTGKSSVGKPKIRAGLILDDDGDTSGEMYFAFLIFLVIGKMLARDKYKAELNAASARTVADRSRLEREIADARLAAMQAQIEPHFLFNTLASIDQLIQSDPPRASKLQKSLIQYLRAAIPQIRSDAQRSSLGKQVDMSMAYLEIMQMRMEERLRFEIRIGESLRGAEFPSMMLQTLIENAIKHGLEPAPEGGSLIISATQEEHCLTVSVSNTGLNYAPVRKPESGTGLANIRERLRLLYGDKGAFTIGAPASGGCLAIISIPYASHP